VVASTVVIVAEVRLIVRCDTSSWLSQCALIIFLLYSNAKAFAAAMLAGSSKAQSIQLPVVRIVVSYIIILTFITYTTIKTVCFAILTGMSKNFSDQGFYEYQTYKWVVLDGDIDAVWIESMNTVMDDNKVLTLVSNERVPLSDAMRMVFEINSLKNATPATVSRAGILFINESDVGWRPFVDSWAAKREDATERKALVELFAKYIDATANLVRKGYKEVTPLRILNKVCTIVYLLEGLLDNSSSSNSGSSNSNSDAPAAVTKHADTLENLFIFALCWAFGGPMVADKSGDCRRKFSEEFSATFPFPASHLPKEGTCFDYYFDTAANAFVEWSSKVPAYTAIPIVLVLERRPLHSLQLLQLTLLGSAH
jgi:dynein heavy chain, axonemal